MRANERTDERVAQYLRLDSWLIQTTVQGKKKGRVKLKMIKVKNTPGSCEREEEQWSMKQQQSPFLCGKFLKQFSQPACVLIHKYLTYNKSYTLTLVRKFAQCTSQGNAACHTSASNLQMQTAIRVTPTYSLSLLVYAKQKNINFKQRSKRF